MAQCGRKAEGHADTFLTVVGFPQEGKLYLTGLLEGLEGNIWRALKIESIIELFVAAYLKEVHKSFFCPEPLSVLYTFDCEYTAGGDQEEGGKEISHQWKSPLGPASICGRWGSYPWCLHERNISRNNRNSHKQDRGRETSGEMVHIPGPSSSGS